MAGTQCTRRFEERSHGRSQGAGTMDGDHAHGALGLDPLDRLNQTIRNTQATDRDGLVKAQGRRSKTMLFQPYRMYRILRIE